MISPPIRIGLFVVPAPFVVTDGCFVLLCLSCSAAPFAGGGGGGGFAFFILAAIIRCLSSTSASRDDGGFFLLPFGLNDMMLLTVCSADYYDGNHLDSSVPIKRSSSNLISLCLSVMQ